MGSKSIWQRIYESHLGKPIILITEVNHFKEDSNVRSYTAYLPKTDDHDSSTESLNKMLLTFLLLKLLLLNAIGKIK